MTPGSCPQADRPDVRNERTRFERQDDRAIRMLRFLIVDRSSVYRFGLRRLLERSPRYEVIGETASSTETILLAAALQPDIVILDVQLAGDNGTETADEIVQSAKHCAVIIVGEAVRLQDVVSVFGRSARGYVLRQDPFEEFVAAIRAVSTGRDYLCTAAANSIKGELAATKEESPLASLTERECDVLTLVGTGATNREVGAKLGITEKTVKHHLTSVYRKLGVRGRVKAVMIAKEHGMW